MKPKFFIIACLAIFFGSCKDKIKSNEFNIYIDDNHPGWHFIDLKHDTLHKGPHKINVRFEKGQTFQVVEIRTDLSQYHPTFLYNNGDTVKKDLWFVGEYIYDTLKKPFLSFYTPTEKQLATKDYTTDSSYTILRDEMDSIVKDYLRRNKEIN